MDNQFKQVRVKPIFAYLKDSFKFYEMDHPVVSQIVFVLQLAVIFGGYIFARPFTQQFLIYYEQIRTRLQSSFESESFDLSGLDMGLYMNMLNAMFTVIVIMTVIKAISFIIGLYYGTYYYYSQTQPDMKGSKRTLIFFARLPKILLFNILFYFILYFGLVVLLLISGMLILIMPMLKVLGMVLPVLALIVNTLYIFKDLLIIEFNVNIFRNFKKTLDLTRGCRKNVITNSLWPLCIGWIVSAFAVDVQNPMMSLFMASFIEAIVILVSQRLTVLMFIDAASLERIKGKQQKNV